MCTDLRTIDEIDWTEHEEAEERYWKLLEEEALSMAVNRLHRGTKE